MERGKKGFSAPVVFFNEKHAYMASLSHIFGFLSSGKFSLGWSLKWCLLQCWLVRDLSCRQCHGPSCWCWCWCCAREMLTSTKCCTYAHGCSVPGSSPWFPMGFQIFMTVLDLFQAAFWHRGLPGTTGGAWASNPADGCVAQANGTLHQKGQNPSVSTHHLPLARPGLRHEGSNSHHRFPFLGLKGLFKSPKVLDSKINTT